MQWAQQTHLNKRAEHQRGFTIVELLIVVVVIAILAAITIVSYNGITQRARYTDLLGDMQAMNKAILMYHSEKGYYPNNGAAANITGTKITIPGLSEYLPTAPTMVNDGLNGYYAYIWSANGADYKLVRLVPGGVTVPQVEQSNPNPDPVRTGRGWGYWSTGGSSL